MRIVETDQTGTTPVRCCALADRGLVKVSGEDAASFLQGLVTNDIAKVSRSAAQYAALLTPQGKILFDFLIAISADGDFLLDCPRPLAADLAKRLGFYRLRAKVRIEDCSQSVQVIALWGDSLELPKIASAVLARFPDPRCAELGWRLIAANEAEGLSRGSTMADYEAHRVELAVPQGGVDFAYGETFPHEANFDRLGGLDFQKGCYVGQEVVSRVEHRGLARRRIVAVRFEGARPLLGVEITAGNASLGTMGSSVEGKGLAMLRLDRVEAARAAGTPIMAGTVALLPELPA